MKIRYAMVLWLALLSGAECGQPVFEPPSIELGQVKVGNEVLYDLKIANTAVAPLPIVKVSTDCFCTTISSKPDEIAPGQSGIVKVKLVPDKAGRYDSKRHARDPLDIVDIRDAVVVSLRHIR